MEYRLKLSGREHSGLDGTSGGQSEHGHEMFVTDGSFRRIPYRRQDVGIGKPLGVLGQRLLVQEKVSGERFYSQAVYYFRFSWDGTRGLTGAQDSLPSGVPKLEVSESGHRAKVERTVEFPTTHSLGKIALRAQVAGDDLVDDPLAGSEAYGSKSLLFVGQKRETKNPHIEISDDTERDAYQKKTEDHQLPTKAKTH
jgi:hypothetical protein